MKEKLEKRLEELKKEFESGQEMLADLDNKRADLRATLLRISGAIQVINEQLNPGEVAEAPSVDSSASEEDEKAEVTLQ